MQYSHNADPGDRWTTSYTAAFVNNGVQKHDRSQRPIFSDEVTLTDETSLYRKDLCSDNVIHPLSTSQSSYETVNPYQLPAKLVITEPVSVRRNVRPTPPRAIVNLHDTQARKPSSRSSAGETAHRCKNAPHPSDYRNFAADETTPHRSVVEHLRAAQRNGFDAKTLDALRQADPLVYRQLMEILTHRAVGLRSSDIRELQDQLALRCMARRQQLARIRAVREICKRGGKEKEIDQVPRAGDWHLSRVSADTHVAATTNKPPFAHYGVGSDTYLTHNVRPHTGVRTAARKSARLRLRSDAGAGNSDGAL